MMHIFPAARRIVCRRSVLTNVALVVIFWLCYTNFVRPDLANTNNYDKLGEHDSKITDIIQSPVDDKNDETIEHQESKSYHLKNEHNNVTKYMNIGQRKREKKMVNHRFFKKKHKLTSPKEDEPKQPIVQTPGLGENGEPVYINEQTLSKSERKKFDKGWKNNAFSEYVSTKISLHRSLPDGRVKECKSLQYPSDLPDTSVIVIFHNEAWTVLLRTVHSVLDRSPPDLIREVILVDDCSTFEHLKGQLQDFVDIHPKLRLVRAPKREGLIRARLLGASVAKGKVLTFLDSHCECTEGWLEPLLSRIHENEHNVVCPAIDPIDTKTFKYEYINPDDLQMGIFDWNMNFHWMVLSEREKNRRKSPAYPIRSPTMAGGLFSISKAYFEKLGTYDRGMDFWGGENLEMSFRIWMCGGMIEIHPCSHVGHIFRKQSPYSSPWGKGERNKNMIRVAEVWMDDYKNYYYERIGNDLGNYGNITDRIELRKRLKCQTFEWYLKNIFPELFIPSDALASGEIRNKAEPKCLDSPLELPNKTKPGLSSYPCHNQGGNQHWMLSSAGEIRRDNSCLDYNRESIKIEKCHGKRGNQHWIYQQDLTIYHPSTGSCIQLSLDEKQIEMASCKRTSRQIWMWKRKEPAEKDQ